MNTSNTETATHHATLYAPPRSNMRWVVCLLIFLATTINYMDRQVLSLIEPILRYLPFMGWDNTVDPVHQTLFNNNYGDIIIWFQVAYGVGFLIAGRVVDKLGAKTGYALAIGIWALSSLSHTMVTSVLGFCIARACLGLGESGNFPAAIKATSEWFPPQERALAVGIFNSGTNFASFVAPPLVAWVTLRWGWRAAFIATGSMGVCWLVGWLLFPYRKQQEKYGYPAPKVKTAPLSEIIGSRKTWAFAVGKFCIDPIWWFYLFYLPMFLYNNYHLGIEQQHWKIVFVYFISSIGSIFFGGLSGWLMKAGLTINAGRKLAMLFCALLVVPIIFVPHFVTLFPTSAWPALWLIAVAAAAHQGFSANLFAMPGDLFPTTQVSTVVGFGGAMGAVGGACFTWIVKHRFALHPLLIFTMAAMTYLIGLLIIQLLVPKIGQEVDTEAAA